MSRRRAAERLKRAELVDELKGFDRHIISKMNPNEEIEHYLNGFDRRMYEWMMEHVDGDPYEGKIREQ